jgi:hypothetical protein
MRIYSSGMHTAKGREMAETLVRVLNGFKPTFGEDTLYDVDWLELKRIMCAMKNEIVYGKPAVRK